MAYSTRAQLAAMVPANVLERALDLDEDNVEDTSGFASLAEVVDGEIDGLLAPSYEVPFATVPALVAHASRVLLAELCYRRYSTAPKDNPWTEQAAALREQLRRIGQGDGQLSTDETGVLRTGDTDADDLDWSLDNQAGL